MVNEKDTHFPRKADLFHATGFRLNTIQSVFTGERERERTVRSFMRDIPLGKGQLIAIAITGAERRIVIWHLPYHSVSLGNLTTNDACRRCGAS